MTLEPSTWRDQEGLAILMSLIALSLFSLLGLYMAINATTEVRVSDNYESQVQARFAAQAGLNHARELLRGLRFDYHLKGPDGLIDAVTTGLVQARTYAFRNPLDWATARSINILDPANDVAAAGDDGVLNTGKYGTRDGTALIPRTGIAHATQDPNGDGLLTTSRYFVKVTDNNGEASELGVDLADDPFVDGDGIIVVRSMGVAQTILEKTGANLRRNSVALFEARYKIRTVFNLDAALVVQGNIVLSSESVMFNGASFLIQGGAINRGIATIDVETTDSLSPAQAISSKLRGSQTNNVQGAGLIPSIQDMTNSIVAHSEKKSLLDRAFLWNFVTNAAPGFADTTVNGNQSWSGGNAPYLGRYDVGRAANDPVQDPRVTLVTGDLSISGNVTGGGILLVRGKFSAAGPFSYTGLILVIGAGDISLEDLSAGINGGIYVVNLANLEGGLTWGTPKMTISGTCNIIMNRDAIDAAARLIPPAQISWREVTSIMDPP
jgi:Tfp pilus assembly protein PilX